MESLCIKITEVNLSVSVYRLFHEISFQSLEQIIYIDNIDNIVIQYYII